ncbi:transketolase, thiamine diphosphate binding domain protein, partial [Vibrio cholerae O1 str. EM-1676A]
DYGPTRPRHHQCRRYGDCRKSSGGAVQQTGSRHR